MALIECPKCGRQISDKAKKCPHCDETLSIGTKKLKLICEECGAELSPDEKTCPNCGCPIGNVEEMERDQLEVEEDRNEIKKDVEETPENEKTAVAADSQPVSSVQKSKSKTGILIAVLVVIIMAVIAAYFGTAKMRAYSAASKDFEAADF